jgi:hypothetical protein
MTCSGHSPAAQFDPVHAIGLSDPFAATENGDTVLTPLFATYRSLAAAVAGSISATAIATIIPLTTASLRPAEQPGQADLIEAYARAGSGPVR